MSYMLPFLSLSVLFQAVYIMYGIYHVRIHLNKICLTNLFLLQLCVHV